MTLVRFNYDAHYIGGEWRTPSTDAVLEVENPATGVVVGHVPDGSVADVEAAIGAARTAFDTGPWPRMSRAKRSHALYRMKEVLEQHREEVIHQIMAESGAIRPVVEGVHWTGGMAHLAFCAEMGLRSFDEAMPASLSERPDGTGLLGGEYVLRHRVGIVAAVTPYNFPFYLTLCKIAPILATGNTVVVKPSPMTPLECLLFGEIAEQTGLPPGVLNVVTAGAEASRTLSTDARVDLMSFTGSDTVGAAIMADAAPTLKRLVLELGGKSAAIVRHDADVEQAAAAAFFNNMWHAGQGCELLTRHIVHDSLKDEYVAHMVELAGKHVIGDPADPSVTLGPLISEAQRSRVESFVQTGVESGATLVTGGHRPTNDCGYYFEPTLFTDVDPSSELVQREIFGPVGVVMGYADDDEAIRLANHSQFGLAGAIFTRDSGTAYRMAARMQTGRVRINGGNGTMSVHSPMGGWKRSGMGVEHGVPGILEYTNAQTVSYNAG